MRPRHQSGWIEERGRKRKYWYGCYSVYVKDDSGQDRRKKTGKFLGYKSQTSKGDAQEKLQKLIFDVTGQGVAPTDKVTLDWFWENRFLPARSATWSDATANGNKVDWNNYISAGLGHLPLSEIDPFVMQKHFNALAKQGRVLSVVRKSKTLLSSVLSYCADLDFLPSNPMIGAGGRHKVKMPKCRRNEKPIVSEYQMAVLIAEIKDRRDRLILVLAYHYGLSAEEVFGLTWDSIAADFIHIRNVAWHGKLYRDSTKRDSRRRNLPLHPDLKAIINNWKFTSSGEGNALLFPGRDSESPMWPNAWLQKHVMPIARRLGIPNVTFQILRRSFSTYELARDPKSVQAIMGHAKPDMAPNVYAQSQEHQMRVLLNERWMRMGLGRPEGKLQ